VNPFSETILYRFTNHVEGGLQTPLLNIRLAHIAPRIPKLVKAFCACWCQAIEKQPTYACLQGCSEEVGTSLHVHPRNSMSMAHGNSSCKSGSKHLGGTMLMRTRSSPRKVLGAVHMLVTSLKAFMPQVHVPQHSPQTILNLNNRSLDHWPN